MLHRIERIVGDARGYASVARELSVGLYQAVTLLARGGHDRMGSLLSEHEAQVRAQLPGF